MKRSVQRMVVAPIIKMYDKWEYRCGRCSHYRRSFQTTPRGEFLPDNERPYARFDEALSIGYGQTCSQPYTVRNMLEWLDVKSGHKVLDVGSGSGWTTALLSKLVGKNGLVVAVERVPELLSFGQANCERLSVKNVQFVYDPAVLGWPAEAPYDRILVSAAADEIPAELIEQLAPNGKMVIPVFDSIWEVSKQNKTLVKTEHQGYIFVPLL